MPKKEQHEYGIVNCTEIIIKYQLSLEKCYVECLGGTSRSRCYAKPNKAILLRCKFPLSTHHKQSQNICNDSTDLLNFQFQCGESIPKFSYVVTRFADGATSIFSGAYLFDSCVGHCRSMESIATSIVRHRSSCKIDTCENKEHPKFN
jgi:hypothetical protein